MSRTGIEKCAEKLFQIHRGSNNESPKLALPKEYISIPSTTQALLLSALSGVSKCEDQEPQSCPLMGPSSPWIPAMQHGGAGTLQHAPGNVRHELSPHPR